MLALAYISHNFVCYQQVTVSDCSVDTGCLFNKTGKPLVITSAFGYLLNIKHSALHALFYINSTTLLEIVSFSAVITPLLPIGKTGARND